MRTLLSLIILLSAPWVFAEESATDCVKRIKVQQNRTWHKPKMMASCLSSRWKNNDRIDCMKAAAEFTSEESKSEQRDLCVKNTKYETATECVKNLYAKTGNAYHRSHLMRGCLLDRQEIMPQEDCLEAASLFPTKSERNIETKLCDEYFKTVTPVNGVNIRASGKK